MHLAILVCGLALLGVGCAKTAPPTAPKSGLTGSPSPTEPIMSPAKTVAGRVSSVNNAARFVVLSYSFGFLPATDQRLNVYRQGQKVGEVKVSGPQQDTNTVADLISGNLQIGDEARPD